MNHLLKSIVKQYNEKAAEVEELKLKLSQYEKKEAKKEPRSITGACIANDYPVSCLASQIEQEIESLKEKYISLADKVINLIDKFSNNNCDCDCD